MTEAGDLQYAVGMGGPGQPHPCKLLGPRSRRLQLACRHLHGKCGHRPATNPAAAAANAIRHAGGRNEAHRSAGDGPDIRAAKEGPPEGVSGSGTQKQEALRVAAPHAE